MALEIQRRREELGIAVLVLVAGLLSLALAWRHVELRDAEQQHALALGQHAAVLARAARGEAQVREPSGHLPLRGMPGFTGTDADACKRLEGFLITALRQLQDGGHPVPYRPHQVPTRVQGTRCAVDDPALGPVLRDLDHAWRAAQQQPVGPLGRD